MNRQKRRQLRIKRLSRKEPFIKEKKMVYKLLEDVDVLKLLDLTDRAEDNARLSGATDYPASESQIHRNLELGM